MNPPAAGGAQAVLEHLPLDIGESEAVNAPAAAPDEHWSFERIELHDELFGRGFILPGGSKEVVSLVTPIGVTSAATLLLVGAASGGAARVLSQQMGLWVGGFESELALAELGARLSREAKLEKRATSEHWDPLDPEFGKKAFHHALLLTPLQGASSAAVLTAISAALKSDGHLVMLEMVAAPKADPADPLMQRWQVLERRLPELPTEHDITALLQRLGFDVRVNEDVTRRHIGMVMAGWKRVIQGIEFKPAAAEAAVMVAEAERWMVRLRLMQEGKLRLIRWHAIRFGVPTGSPPREKPAAKPA